MKYHLLFLLQITFLYVFLYTFRYNDFLLQLEWCSLEIYFQLEKKYVSLFIIYSQKLFYKPFGRIGKKKIIFLTLFFENIMFVKRYFRRRSVRTYTIIVLFIRLLHNAQSRNQRRVSRLFRGVLCSFLSTLYNQERRYQHAWAHRLPRYESILRKNLSIVHTPFLHL